MARWEKIKCIGFIFKQAIMGILARTMTPTIVHGCYLEHGATHMKAEKARAITSLNITNSDELKLVFEKIIKCCENGLYETYFTNLKDSTKGELIRQGYAVSSYFSRNESSDTVSWGTPTKTHEKMINYDSV